MAYMSDIPRGHLKGPSAGSCAAITPERRDARPVEGIGAPTGLIYWAQLPGLLGYSRGCARARIRRLLAALLGVHHRLGARHGHSAADPACLWRRFVLARH